MDQTLSRPPIETASGAIGPRNYGAMNWLGLWTLCLRETRRFWKVGMQTLDMALIELVRRNMVSVEEAQSRTLTPNLFASNAVERPTAAAGTPAARVAGGRS